MSERMPLADRIALVTGASRGIGNAVAAELVASGATVACVGRNAITLKQAIEGFEGCAANQVVPIAADLTVPSQVSQAIAEATTKLGPLDLVVHAAGSGGFFGIENLTPEAWADCRSANLDALVYLATAVVPAMAARGAGDLVAILSIAAVHTFPGAAAYCAAKAGALAFLRSVREEVRRSGVRVSAILPGSVDTPFWDQYDLGLDRQRMLTARDVARAVVAVATASPRASLDEVHVLPRDGIL